METNKEINALLTLIDDPDEEVFDVVSEKLVGFGKPIIPNLENLWETIHSEAVQGRIESIIHRLHYDDLVEEFMVWIDSDEDPDLLEGALLINKFNFPELSTKPLIQEIEKIKRNIWLELNSYLTPLEEVSILSSILHNYYSLKGVETDYKNPNDFLINKLIESKKGNQFSNGLLYLHLCELLDLPVRVMNIPNQMILAYYKNNVDGHEKYPKGKIEFFIDPSTGLVFTHKDLNNYFKRISAEIDPSYYIPKTNKEVIQLILTQYSKCFTDESNKNKQQELLVLSSMLDKEK
jgi:hypothetical protein